MKDLQDRINKLIEEAIASSPAVQRSRSGSWGNVQASSEETVLLLAARVKALEEAVRLLAAELEKSDRS